MFKTKYKIASANVPGWRVIRRRWYSLRWRDTGYTFEYYEQATNFIRIMTK